MLTQFNDIFTILVRLAMDADQNVKNGSEMLDRIMKVRVDSLPIVVSSRTFSSVVFFQRHQYTEMFV